MTFSLQYELDKNRLISAVINDSRGTIPSLKGANGMQIYSYIQSVQDLVTPGVVVYRIIVLNSGVLCGIVGLNTNPGQVGVVFQQNRPAFIPYSSEISQAIGSFISSNGFLQDILY